MAAEDMGASSQTKTKQQGSSKPKLAPKPPILTSTTRSTVQPTLLKVLKPIISDSKERCTKKEDTGGDLLSCANSIACNPEECDLTRNNSTVNNIAAIRRGRVTKAPKPLPYLVPISTRSDQRSVGRSLSSLGQRRVTFAATSKRFQRRRRRRVERTRSEKSTRIKKPVLAYLVVDLESGALARSLDDLCEPKTGSLSTAAIHFQTAIAPSTKQKTMSVTASNRPKPAPRRKPEVSHITPAENKSNTLPLSPKTEKEQLPVQSHSSPNKEDTPSPTQQSTSSHLPAFKSATSMSLPRSKGRPSITPRKRNTSNPEIPPVQSPQSLPLSPLCNDRDKPDSTSPTLTQSTNNPPPLPAKSELSRKIQSSIKSTIKSPVSPEPYESPIKCEENLSIYTQQNDSYGTPDMVELDRPSSEYEILEADDAPEEMYIDPAKSQQFSSTGKPKPPRPPPPSISAIRKAQQKKASNTSAVNSKVPKSGNVRNLTRHHSASNKRNVIRRGKSLEGLNKTKLYNPDDHKEDGQVMEYEELDVNITSPVHSTLWRPPQSTGSNKRNEPPPAGNDAPNLPARTHDSTKPTKTQHRKKDTPSGFSRSSSSGNIHRVAHDNKYTKKDEILNSEKSKLDLTEPDYGDDCVYEPVDSSMPIIPQRTKKHIRVTRAQTGENNRYTLHNPKPPAPQRIKGSPTSKSDPLSRRSLPPQQRISRLTTDSSRRPPQTKLKPMKSLPGGGKSVVDKLAQMKIQDEKEVEEYVQMECKIAWEEGEDSQGVYVDMQPSSEGIEDEQEDGSSLKQHSSSNLLSSKSDIKT